MKHARGIMLGWYAGFGLVAVAIALLVFPYIWTVACEKKQAPQADEIRVTRTKDGDVTIDVQGPATYLAWTFIPSKLKEDSPWHFMVEVIALGEATHQVDQSFSHVRSVTLKNVTCRITKRDTKGFKKRFGREYTLIKGADAKPGEKLSVKGTFMWNSKDGDDHFFHEEGTGRVWQTAPSKKEEKKE